MDEIKNKWSHFSPLGLLKIEELCSKMNLEMPKPINNGDYSCYEIKQFSILEKSIRLEWWGIEKENFNYLFCLFFNKDTGDNVHKELKKLQENLEIFFEEEIKSGKIIINKLCRGGKKEGTKHLNIFITSFDLNFLESVVINIFKSLRIMF